MSSSVHFRFKSARDFETLSFEGDFLKVADLKVAIVERKKLNFGEGFDLEISDSSTKDVFNDESALVQKNTSVIVRRIPGLKQGGILSRQEMAGKNERFAEKHASKVPDTATPVDQHNPNVPKTIEGSDEAARIDSLVMQSSVQYDQFPLHSRGRYGGRGNYRGGRGGNFGSARHGHGPPSSSGGPHSNNIQNMYPDRAPRPSHNYVCHRCNKPGHWIDQCPTNGDPTYDKIKVRAPTGIPRSMLRQVDAPESGTGLQDSSGHFVTLQPNDEEFVRQTVGLRLSQAAAAAALGRPEPIVGEQSKVVGEKLHHVGDVIGGIPGGESSAGKAVVGALQDASSGPVPEPQGTGTSKGLPGDLQSKGQSPSTGTEDVDGNSKVDRAPNVFPNINGVRPEAGRGNRLVNKGGQARKGHPRPGPGMPMPGMPMPGMPPGFPPMGMPPFPPGMPPPPPHVFLAMMANNQNRMPPLPPGMMPNVGLPFAQPLPPGNIDNKTGDVQSSDGPALPTSQPVGEEVKSEGDGQKGSKPKLKEISRGIALSTNGGDGDGDGDGDGCSGAQCSSDMSAPKDDSPRKERISEESRKPNQQELDHSMSEKIDSAFNSKSESPISRERPSDSGGRKDDRQRDSPFHNDDAIIHDTRGGRESRQSSRSRTHRSPPSGRSPPSPARYHSPERNSRGHKRSIGSFQENPRPHRRDHMYTDRDVRRSRRDKDEEGDGRGANNEYRGRSTRLRSPSSHRQGSYSRRRSMSPPSRERRGASSRFSPHRHLRGSRSPVRRRYNSIREERRDDASRYWRERRLSPRPQYHRDSSNGRRPGGWTPPPMSRYDGGRRSRERPREDRLARQVRSPVPANGRQDFSERIDDDKDRRRHDDYLSGLKDRKSRRSPEGETNHDLNSEENGRSRDLRGNSRTFGDIPDGGNGHGSVESSLGNPYHGQDRPKRDRDPHSSDERLGAKRYRRDRSLERRHISRREERRDRLSVHHRLGRPLGDRKKNKRRSVHDRLG